MTAPEMVILRVSGTPAPQGSKSAFIVTPKGGKPRAVITDGKKGSPGRLALDKWREAVSTAGRDWMGDHDDPPLLDGPLRLWATFWLPPPSTLSRWRWLPWTKPDADKLLRATLDGLSKVVYADDARVVELHVRKLYAITRGPGAVIRIQSIRELEAELGRAWVAAGCPLDQPPTLP